MADPRAALTITLIKSTRPARVCKVYTLLDDGKLDKHGVASMTEGIARATSSRMPIRRSPCRGKPPPVMI